LIEARMASALHAPFRSPRCGPPCLAIALPGMRRSNLAERPEYGKRLAFARSNGER
jgi:hypothetical protein